MRHFTQQQQDRCPDTYRGIRRNKADTESTYRHDHDSYRENFCRPYLSPSIPKNRPPNGRIKMVRRRYPARQSSARLGWHRGRRLYLRRRPQSRRRRNRTTPSRCRGGRGDRLFSLPSSMMVTSLRVMGFIFPFKHIFPLLLRLECTPLRRMARPFASCVRSGELLCSSFQA